MKQTIDPRLGALIAIVGVLALVGIGMWVWMKPTAAPVAADRPGAVKVYTDAEMASRPKALSEKSKEMFDSRREAMEGRRALMGQQGQNSNAPSGPR